ncbi:MAG: hypothetical protein ABI678_11145 [Kofleriaceae bacterium]
MLDGLFVAPALAAVGEALRSAHAEEGTVAVSPRASKKHAGALDDLSSIEPRSLAAVIAVDVSLDETWQASLEAWSRVVRDGGAIVLLDRGHAPETSRRALCAGLTEVEQRRAGRTIVTSGLVSHLV